MKRSPVIYLINKFKILFPRISLFILKIKRSPLLSEKIAETPWISKQATLWLDSHIDKNSKIFEYGCGGSTIFFAKRAGKVFSVENEVGWYLKVINQLKKERLDNCKIYCIEPQISKVKTDEMFKSVGASYKGMDFKKYVNKIREFPENFFDLIFIDGRARNGCVAQSLSKIKDGGYLVLDNSDRLEYSPSINLLKKFERLKFFDPSEKENHIEETTVWTIKNRA